MNRFEIDLLKQALSNYHKTGEASGILLGKNADETFYYSNALDSLIEQGYAEPTYSDYSPDRVKPRGSYELTEKGLNYAKQNLAD